MKKKKTTASGKLVLVKSVRRTRSHRMKFCVQRGLGALPSTSKRRGKSQRDFLLCGPVCINTGIACQVIPKSLWLRLVLVSGLPFLLLFLDFSQNVDILPARAEQLRALLTTEAHLCGGVGNFVFKYAHIHALHIVGQIPQRHVPRTGVVGGYSLRVNSLHAVFYI